MDHDNIDPEIERIRWLGAGSYSHLRRLEDGTIIGIGRLMFTTAIFVDMNEWGWTRRFCFDDPALALAEYLRLRTDDDEPAGWIARRPERPCNSE